MPITNDIERLHGRISELEARVAKLEGVTDDGWIGWNGGECPVDGDTRVGVIFRDGDDGEGLAGDVLWDNTGTDGDIIAYRVVK